MCTACAAVLSSWPPDPLLSVRAQGLVGIPPSIGYTREEAHSFLQRVRCCPAGTERRITTATEVECAGVPEDNDVMALSL